MYDVDAEWPAMIGKAIILVRISAFQAQIKITKLICLGCSTDHYKYREDVEILGLCVVFPTLIS
jgi:hypothetical protein